jgi:predicted GNAT family acetyltransferase
MADESVHWREDGGHGRFSLVVEGAEADMTYAMRGQIMVIDHTFTPPALRGHGLASRLMRAAADHARANGLKISPLCSYADAWMRRHKEEHDLLA